MQRLDSPEIPFFDSNACLGRSVYRTPGSPYDKTGLLEEMDHCRISRALVFHAEAREQDSRQANYLLINECAAESRFVPCVVLNPTPFIAGRDLAEELDSFIHQGISAFRMFPNYHTVDFSSPMVHRVLKALEERKAMEVYLASRFRSTILLNTFKSAKAM